MAATGINNDCIQVRDLTDLECVALSKEEILQLYRNCHKILTDILKQDESQKESIEDYLLASHLEHIKFMEWIFRDDSRYAICYGSDTPLCTTKKDFTIEEVYQYWQKHINKK